MVHISFPIIYRQPNKRTWHCSGVLVFSISSNAAIKIPNYFAIKRWRIAAAGLRTFDLQANERKGNIGNSFRFYASPVQRVIKSFTIDLVVAVVEVFVGLYKYTAKAMN